MMRWILLAVAVVAITATATVVVQNLPSEDASGTGRVAYPTATGGAPGDAKPQATPKVVIDEDLIYHFGTKAQLTKFEKDWVVKNEGKGTLTLKLEAPACSCTVAGFQKKDTVTGETKVTGETIDIPPGGQHPVHFTWETRTYNEKYRKPVTILTNDPEHPRLEFAAEGEVFPAVVVYPSDTIEYSELSTDETSHRMGVALFSPDMPEMKIVKISTSKPELVTVAQEPLSADDCKSLKVKAGYRIHVDIHRGLPLGAFREEVIVLTDHPKKPETRLILSGKMVGPITVLPAQRVYLTDVSSSAGVEKDLTLLVRGQRETKFEVAQAPKNLKVEVVPGDKDPKGGKTSKVSRYRMIVTIPPGCPVGTIEDLIILKTDHPQAGELRIPVNIVVRDPAA